MFDKLQLVCPLDPQPSLPGVDQLGVDHFHLGYELALAGDTPDLTGRPVVALGYQAGRRHMESVASLAVIHFDRSRSPAPNPASARAGG